MNLHEYQGKALFAEYNLPVSKGKIIYSADEVTDACNEIGGTSWVVKAQVHAGGRGKSGGVQLINTPEDGIKFAEKWLGNNLVTYQTDAKGQPVNSILIEECTNISQELYLSAVIDRDSQKIVFIGSSEGGVNIEDVEKNIPEKIEWVAEDSLSQDLKESKSISLSLWDDKKKNTLRIDLWTKEMTTDDMKKFYIDCLGGLSQSILNSTGDEFMSKETNNLCEKLIEHIKNKSE